MELWTWGAIGAALTLAEILTPGYFLVFPAAGAFIVGLTELAGLRELNAQLAVFAIATVVLFAVSFRPYRRMMSRRAMSSLNMPDRLLGSIGTVEDPIAHGSGKIRLADSVWLARGPDLPKGSPVTVVAVNGTVLTVEPRL